MTPKEKRKRDREFSKLILERDNRICQWCGRTNCKVDCSHVIPREILATRYSPDNAFTLCSRCHKFGNVSWHKSPLAGVRWLEGKIGVEGCNALLSASIG